MKKSHILSVLTFLVLAGAMQAQDTIKPTRDEQNRIIITPELAKMLTLYEFVSVIDSGIFAINNNYCIETDFDCGYYDDIRDDNNTCYFDRGENAEGITAEMGYEENNYGKYRYVDSDGKALTPYTWGSRSDFKNGYAIVTDFKGESDMVNTPYGRLISMQRYIIDERGHKRGANYSLMDSHGRTTIPMKKYDVLAGYVSEGVLPALKGGKWGYVTPQGVVKIALQYEAAHPFGEGLAAVKKGGKWGFIDIDGNEVIPFRYDNAYTFRQGVAMVEMVVNGVTICGLVDHTGLSTFDYLQSDTLGGIELKHYSDDQLRYSYYEKEGKEVKHGYYVSRTRNLREDGHYRDGKKKGLWVKEYNIFESNNAKPFFHDAGYGPMLTAISYANDVPNGSYTYYTYDDEKGSKNISGMALNGKAAQEISIDFNSPIKIDAEGNITDVVSLYATTTRNEYKTLEISFIYGIPFHITETDQYNTNLKRTIFHMDGINPMTKLGDTVIGLERRHYKTAGGRVYTLEPLTYNKAKQQFGLDIYTDESLSDIQWLFDFPTSFPIKEIEGPKVNLLREVPEEELLEMTYAQYGNLYESKEEFRSAYKQGQRKFMASVKQKQAEKREKSYNRYHHLFCSLEEFDNCYDSGDELFSAEVTRLNRIYNNEYLPNKTWFDNYCDYLAYNKQGDAILNEELNQRRTSYEINQDYFPDIKDFLSFYKLGGTAIISERDKRDSLYQHYTDPFTDSMLFNDLREFLNYYSDGIHDKVAEQRKENIRMRYHTSYGRYFLSEYDFESHYEKGRKAFLQEAVTRLFSSHLEEYKSLKLVGAKQSSKTEVMAYLRTVDECVSVSPDAYPDIIHLILGGNKNMQKEWQKNGSYFDNEITFYEAYISATYKEILKQNKRK